MPSAVKLPLALYMLLVYTNHIAGKCIMDHLDSIRRKYKGFDPRNGFQVGGLARRHGEQSIYRVTKIEDHVIPKGMFESGYGLPGDPLPSTMHLRLVLRLPGPAKASKKNVVDESLYLSRVTREDLAKIKADLLAMAADVEGLWRDFDGH